MGSLTTFFFAPRAGDPAGAETFVRTRSLFVRILGVIYLCAFASLAAQAPGLLGPRGISPIGSFLEAVAGQTGSLRFWWVPSFFWIPGLSSHPALVAGLGALLSLIVVAGFCPAASLALVWAVYLSFVSVGGPFLRFQWDALLLETGFLAIFLAPLSLRLDRGAPPSAAILLLFRWLVFRLMISSGLVKLASGDVAWRTCSALLFHYQMQPLPTALAWYLHQAPGWFHRFSCAGMFAIELMAPLLVFARRRWRHPAAYAMIALQVLIALTGNYGFFNFLSVALCLMLLDDAWWQRIGPVAVVKGVMGRTWPRKMISLVTVLVLLVSTPAFFPRVMPSVGYGPLGIVYQLTAPFEIASPYGLFAVMTTKRGEITVEGSVDGKRWKPYAFKCKPGDPKRRPGFIAPHMPRLDWQMWFAALGDVRGNTWFFNLAARLLDGSPDVASLLGSNPFPESPPRFIRATIADYRFTDPAERAATGAWWVAGESSLYCEPLSLRADAT